MAEAICSASWLEESDLAGYAAAWIEPLRVGYRDVEVAELPPPTQGVAALEALALLDGLEPTLPNQARCAQLALEDASRPRARRRRRLRTCSHPRRSSDGARGARPGGSRSRAAARSTSAPWTATERPSPSSRASSATSARASSRPARASCSRTAAPASPSPGASSPGGGPTTRSSPGCCSATARSSGPFGVMGGFIQAQAHMQLVSGLVDQGLDPQAALDQPRFRVEGDAVFLEEGLWERAAELERDGLRGRVDDDTVSFGGGQAILRTEDGAARRLRPAQGRLRGRALTMTRAPEPADDADRRCSTARGRPRHGAPRARGRGRAHLRASWQSAVDELADRGSRRSASSAATASRSRFRTGPEFVELLLAIAALGAAAAPLNPAYSERRVRLLPRRPRSPRRCSLPARRARRPRARRPATSVSLVDVTLAPGDGRPSSSATRRVARRARRRGRRRTTSRCCCTRAARRAGPKQVPLRQRNLTASARDDRRATTRSTADDVSYCAMPLFHVHGLVASTLRRSSPAAARWSCRARVAPRALLVAARDARRDLVLRRPDAPPDDARASAPTSAPDGVRLRFVALVQLGALAGADGSASRRTSACRCSRRTG